MDFIPNTDNDRKDMLKVIGVNSVKELFRDIPENILLKKNLKIPEPLSELDLREHMEAISNKNKINFSCFLGAGAYNHFIPATVNAIISRSEFYTAYTPYQPEISQGILQVIYEYQTMICDLTGMDVSNASMYDGATALAESCIMAANITGRNKILVSKAIHPEYREVVKTYAHFHNMNLVEVDFDDGIISINDLKNKISEKTAAVLIQNPNFFGCIENISEIEKIVHNNKSLLVVCVVEPTSLGILKSPGDLNVDIVAGEGQSFGNPLSFGGPYLGIIAAKQEYIRHMPGRLVGLTTDTKGNRGFILTLQTREQHIRREKAGSNICSNEALNALAATVYLSTLGKQGIKKVGQLCLQKAHYAFDKLQKAGFKAFFNSHFYNEFVIKVDDSEKIQKLLLKNKIVGGFGLSKFYPELKNCMLFSVTELNTKKDIDKLVKVMKKNETNL